MRCYRLLAEQRTEKQPRAGITARAMPTGTLLAVHGNLEFRGCKRPSDWVTMQASRSMVCNGWKPT